MRRLGCKSLISSMTIHRFAVVTQQLIRGAGMKIVSVSAQSPNELEIEIEGESHTLGHLISTELLALPEVELAYYAQDHPLKSSIKIYVRTKHGHSPFDVLEKAVTRIKDVLNSIKTQLENEL